MGHEPLWCSGILNAMKGVSGPVAAAPNTREAVRRLRAARGISVRELAARVGVSPATISAIENGKTGISIQRLHQIATALAVPAASLVEDPPAPTQPRNAGPSSVQLGTGNWRDFAPLPIGPVLAGAIKAFVATGYHGASMRSIAQFANMSVPGVYHHYPSKQDLLVKILDITMMDLLWRLQHARDDGNNPIERIALVVEALALFHTRRSDLSFIGTSEMRSLEPHHYRRIGRLRDEVQHLLDTEIAAAITAGDLAVNYRRDAGKAIATMCTALVQWFQPDGLTTPEQIAKEYAQFALRLLGYNAMRQPQSRDLASAAPAGAAGSRDVILLRQMVVARAMVQRRLSCSRGLADRRARGCSWLSLAKRVQPAATAGPR